MIESVGSPIPSSDLGRSTPADLDLTCPRCSTTTDVRFYGPCPSCRAELGLAVRGNGRDQVEAVEYEPKMNVTPNAVALKDD